MSRFGDVVVVIPGLIGSKLVKDGKALWGTSPGALWSVVAGNGLKALTMSGPDHLEEDLGDGIKAAGLIDNPEIIPGLWKQGGYSRLRESLVKSHLLQEGKNYFEFSYDWRRDNRVNARKLMHLAHKWLNEWREYSGNNEARIVIVAHSMGGLIARYFIECLEGWKTLRFLVAIGTPFRGSGNALNFLVNGFKWKVGPITAFEGTEALLSFPSVSQLLPSYPFVAAQGNDYCRLSEIRLTDLDKSRSDSARAFYDEVNNAQDRNSRVAAYQERGQLLYPIVGTEQPTWQCGRISSGSLTMLKRYPGERLDGDGTVSRVAALPIEMGVNTGVFVPNTHSALQSCEPVLAHLRALMTGATISEQRFRSATDANHIAIDIEDSYDSSKPVEIRATTSSRRRSLVAAIERHDQPEFRVRMPLEAREDQYVANVSLAPGLYKVTMRGEGCVSVSDLFLVSTPNQ